MPQTAASVQILVSHDLPVMPCCVTGDMYQHFEVSTPSIRLLQEVTDRAVDDASKHRHPHHFAQRPHLHHHQQYQPPQQASMSDGHRLGSSRAGGVEDAEAGLSAAQGGLTDWLRLERQLHSWTWSGRFSRLAGRLGYSRLQELLSQREVSS
jgi:hypothetical protein